MSYDFFSSMFGTSNDTSSSYGIFGTGSNMLGDYAMIKSGTYKKLLKSYYNTSDSDDSKTSSSSTSKTKTDSVETARLVNVKTDSQNLMDAASKLNDKSLYQATGKDEDGKDVYDRDTIKKNVKSFVEAYNSYIDSTSNVDNLSVLNKSLSLVKLTASNQKLLKEAGITIGAGNKLILDESKLDEAKMSTLISLFTGRNSFAGEVSQKASATYSVANSATYTGGGASSYTYNGAYSRFGTSSYSLDQYL